MSKEKRSKLSEFGKYIQDIRIQKSVPLRKVGAFLDIDQSIVSKIENGHRKATKEQVKKLAEYYSVKEDKLLKLWLKDKIIYEVKDEEYALEALKAAEKEIEYNSKNQK